MKEYLNRFLKLLTSIAWCLSLAWKASRKYTIIRISSGVIIPGLTILTAFVGKQIIDLLAGQGYIDLFFIHYQPHTMLLILLIGLFVVAMCSLFMQRSTQYCQVMHDDILNGRLSLIIMGRALSADLEYFDNPAYHDKLMSASSDSYALVSIVWSVLNSVSASISFVGAFLVLWRVNFMYGLIMLVAALPSSILSAQYTKRLYKLALEQINDQRQMGYVQSIAMDRYHAQGLRLYGSGEKLTDKYQRLWSEIFAKRRRITRKRALVTGLLESLPEAAMAWIGINIALRVFNKQATVGDYSLYIGLVGQLWGATSMLSTSIINIYDNQMKIENFEAVENFQNHVIDDGKEHLHRVETIAFEEICFTYPGTSHGSLDHVSFQINKNEKIALVGLNGSGKSTLVKLLLRLYAPDSGIIRINGVDIKEYTLTSLRTNFSVYFQDMQNFSFSLRENFTIADDGQIDVDKGAEAALHSASGDDILEKSGKNFDTGLTRMFESSGIELSGGQHQKLALARSLFRRHTVLILDEPSSNLDPKAEHDIFEFLKTHITDRMAIFTSHRLSNISLADRIIVLEKGRIVEEGTEQELLKNQQRYAELFKYQQEKYAK